MKKKDHSDIQGCPKNRIETKRGVKWMKKASAVILTACLATSAAGCTDSSKNKEDYEVTIPEYQEDLYVQIFADCPPSGVDEDALQEYFGEAFTGWILTEDGGAITDENGVMTEDYKKRLELGSKYGDVYIRNHYNYPYYWMNEETTEIDAYGGVKVTIPKRSITTEFETFEKVKGFYQCDEPSYDAIDTLLPLVEWQNQYAKDKLFHINLFPSYATGRFSGHSMEEYVQHYVDTVLAKVETPKTLGLDNYPLQSSGKENFLRTTYLSDLFTISNIAKEYNSRKDKTSDITVGFCIQSFIDPGIRDVECKEDISFQTNTCLAMGAKYFEYFLYNTTENMIGILQNGEKRPLYDYVKETNEELQKWDHVIMAFDWLGAMTVDGDDEHENETAFNYVQQQELTELRMVKSVKSRLDTLIGEFVDKDGNYGYMTVNYTEPSNHKLDYVTYTFPEEVRAALVYQKGEAQVYQLEAGQLTLRIESGGAAFVIPCK